LATRTASRSSSAGITLRTGPTISSRAIVAPLSTLPNTVGSTDQPRSRWAGRCGGERRAFPHALVDVPQHPVALAFGGQRPHLDLGVERVADTDLRERR
jgi:hypothetical protein